MLVKDMMTRNPVTVSPETSILDAKDIMTKHNIKKLPVLDRSGSLAGILTRNDLIKAAPSDATTLDMFELSYLLSKLTAEKVMRKDVKTVTENETVEEAARLMEDYGIGCLPVLKNKLLVGIVTESDLFRTFIDMFDTRSAGVRATVIVDEKPGQLGKISQAIADLGGNIVAVVTCPASMDQRRKVTVKASGITLEQCRSIMGNCGAKIEDIRNV
ncbi:MAG TPA: hypothetical protein DDW78_07450 [Treponema sp.]|nr:hypothetical protein [Treponema sp.]